MILIGGGAERAQIIIIKNGMQMYANYVAAGQMICKSMA